jgi:hypothetical protein
VTEKKREKERKKEKIVILFLNGEMTRLYGEYKKRFVW